MKYILLLILFIPFLAFNQNYTMSNGSVSSCSGTFYDSGGNGSGYSSYETYVFTICPGVAGQYSEVDFTMFDTESGYDALTIYDGNSTSSPVLGVYSGSGSPGTITSSDASGCLTFEFDSDVSLQYAGWVATVSCSTTPGGGGPGGINMTNGSTSTCSEDFYDSGGNGSNYGTNESYVYTICPDVAGQYSEVDFTMFNTENSYDELTIYDGSSTASPVLGIYSGTSGPGTITSSDASGCLTFEFTSDGSFQYSGWEATVSCSVTPGGGGGSGINMTNGSSSICSGDFYDSGGNGSNYSSNETYVYTICPDVAGQFSEVDFTMFDTESGYDELTIYDGNSTAFPVLGTYSGTTSPGTVTSSDGSGCLTFEFTSDGSVTDPGWDATVSCSVTPGSGGGGGSGCVNTTAYGTETAPTNGTTVTINTCLYQVEYNTINSVVAGNTYESGIDCGGYITVRSGSYNGPIVASGNAPLSWTATTSGTHYIHYNTNSSCGTATSCCTTTITCTSCATPTCSDGIQNQGETGVDCGGPCPACVPNSGPFIPTVCGNNVFNMNSNSTANFYDDGGPGGDCNTGGVSGNFSNSNCITTTTICAASGEYIIANFLVFSMFNTTSGFDWMVIYDGPDVTSPILFDNRSGAPQNDIGTDCNYDGVSNYFCGSSQCMTFQFFATSVVDTEGWHAIMTSTPYECSPLAIDNLTFKGEPKINSNLLSWEIDNDLQCDYYILEGSINGVEFEELGKIESKNTNSNYNYFFEDFSYFESLTYYRLVKVDYNGNKSKSQIESIYRKDVSSTIKIYPNPSSGIFNIDFIGNETVYTSIKVYDQTGRVVYALDNFVGRHIEINLQNLSSGLYTLSLINDFEKKNFKIIKD